ncbi:jupiter microtubule associated homolog 2 [Bufo bufo]|uniref:jupiter microtubule associated homolog 2 n=1 Tax=Bufo bufo TaxID=8384 RepID=UPI001ABE927C|nr:jupiter microtubule associated homolog 2 [Bufo bufo]
MTSTNTFHGLETANKPSSRVLKPPGGGSSCIFGNADEGAAPRRQNKMSSNIFEGPSEPENLPKRSNPPGGKTSIFQDPEPVKSPVRQKTPGGKGSDIFGDAKLPSSPKAHPNKPKDNISLKLEVKNNPTPVKVDPPPPPPTPVPTPEEKIPVAKEEKVAVPDPGLAAHEPHLGPRPRCHNRVLNPPGGKSSVTFY